MAAIRKPIEIPGVLNTILGVGRRSDGMYYVADLCTSPNINKWALYKPVRSSKIEDLTKDDMIGAHCGLSSVALAKLKVMDIVEATGSYTKEQVLAEVATWPYAQPRGIAYNEWHRANDFVGYEPDSLPSDQNWDDKTISRSQLLDAQAASASIASGSGSSQCLTATYSLIIGNGAMRFSEASADAIGGVGTLNLPVTYITGEGVLTEDWRLGYAVCLPYGSGHRWGLVVGRNPIRLARNASTHYIEPSLALPDLITNQAVVDALISATPSTGGTITSFQCIPVLVKGAFFQGYNSATRFRTLMASTGITPYCMPSGVQSFNLNIQSGQPLPDIPGASIYKSLGNDWYICTIPTGTYTPYGASIMQIAILRAVATLGSGTFSGNITCSYSSGTGPASTTTIAVNGVRTASTFTVNGYTFHGFTVATYPAVQITNSTVTVQ